MASVWQRRRRYRCIDELPDLLFERHLAEQAIDAGLECRIGKLRV